MSDCAIPVYGGMWNSRLAVKHCLCSDGKRRYARITADCDTFFSQPASVRVKGKTVSGYVTTGHGEFGSDWHFTPNCDGKNADLLPNWHYSGGEAYPAETQG